MVVHPVYDVVVWCTIGEFQEVLVAFMIVDFVHLVPLLEELVAHRDDFLAVVVQVILYNGLCAALNLCKCGE